MAGPHGRLQEHRDRDDIDLGSHQIMQMAVRTARPFATRCGRGEQHFAPGIPEPHDETVVSMRFDQRTSNHREDPLKVLKRGLKDGDEVDVSPQALLEWRRPGSIRCSATRPLKRAIQQRIENPVAKLDPSKASRPKDVIPVGASGGVRVRSGRCTGGNSQPG